MNPSEYELQLKVWKDLAISKQVLIGAATEALGLTPECKMDELKEALENAIKRAKDADTEIAKAQQQAQQDIDEMKKKVAEIEMAKESAEQQQAEALSACKTLEEQLAAGRSANAEALKNTKSQLAQKEKELKEINIALADTPQNVVKKLKKLKKQKLDESNARKKAETEARNLRKEKQQLEKNRDEQQAIIDSSATLVGQFRELRTICEQQQEQLKPLLDDENHLTELPEVDEPLLESIEQAASSDTKEENDTE